VNDQTTLIKNHKRMNLVQHHINTTQNYVDKFCCLMICHGRDYVYEVNKETDCDKLLLSVVKSRDDNIYKERREKQEFLLSCIGSVIVTCLPLIKMVMLMIFCNGLDCRRNR
jgi:hypothetical protein